MIWNRVQATQARARFAELLRRVERGETVVITRHGWAVARMAPEQEAEREDYAQAVARFRHRRKEWESAGISLEEIIQMRHEGHCW